MVVIVYWVVLRLHITFSGLAKVAIFTTNVNAENQTLINHKCVCGALNRHFCQTRVTSWCSFCRYSIVHCFRCLGALAWWLFWIFLALVCVWLQKIQMCHQMRWIYASLFEFVLNFLPVISPI